MDIGGDESGIYLATVTDFADDTFFCFSASQDFQDNRAGSIAPEDLAASEIEDNAAVRVGDGAEVLRETQHWITSKSGPGDACKLPRASHESYSFEKMFAIIPAFGKSRLRTPSASCRLSHQDSTDVRVSASILRISAIFGELR